MATKLQQTVKSEYDSLRSPSDHLFSIIMPIVMILVLGTGYFLKQVKPVVAPVARALTQIKTQFIIQSKQFEPVKKAAVPRKIESKEAPREKIPFIEEKKAETVDLTQNPVLGQTSDDMPQNPKDATKAVKRVYGLRRVYSLGLGSTGSMSDAVVGKLGNTLDKEIDTLQATPEEIKGAVVPTTTVTQAPRFTKIVKPSYTKEMIDNKIQGTIQVKVLVDIDGRVKQAVVLNDLGFGSKDRALEACYQMLFDPAKRGDESVAVWIMIPIRFVLLG